MRQVDNKCLSQSTSPLGLVAIAVIAGAMIAGILTIGGPGAGRERKLDVARADALAKVEALLRCPKQSSLRKILPIDVSYAKLRLHCASHVRIRQEDLRDPVSGHPVQYRRISDMVYHLCADFSDPSGWHLRRWSKINPATGCLEGSLKDPSGSPFTR